MSWLQSVWDLNFHFQDIPLPSLTILPEMFLATAAWETKELAAYSLPSALYHETLKRLSRGHYAFRRDGSTYRGEWKDVFSKLLISPTHQLITGLNVWQLGSCWLEDFLEVRSKRANIPLANLPTRPHGIWKIAESQCKLSLILTPCIWVATCVAWEQENGDRETLEEAAVKRHLYFAVYRRSANCFRLVSLLESNECCGDGGSSGGQEVCLPIITLGVRKTRANQRKDWCCRFPRTGHFPCGDFWFCLSNGGTQGQMGFLDVGRVH